MSEPLVVLESRKHEHAAHYRPSDRLLVDGVEVPDGVDPVPAVNAAHQARVAALEQRIADLTGALQQVVDMWRPLHEGRPTAVGVQVISWEFENAVSAVHRALGPNPTPYVEKQKLIDALRVIEDLKGSLQ